MSSNESKSVGGSRMKVERNIYLHALKFVKIRSPKWRGPNVFAIEIREQNVPTGDYLRRAQFGVFVAFETISRKMSMVTEHWVVKNDAKNWQASISECLGEHSAYAYAS
ncbi:hypothetical protein AC579_2648 [Pseudocercospora musae]|uniref:Uncharacterized protein n=1 Tax=Pseudocercospora musae TaxID=113226 RepID=A0A139IGG2_9PEZI|nr:hypothetical protein AC579_2648 [Pseudocercospora musae]